MRDRLPQRQQGRLRYVTERDARWRAAMTVTFEEALVDHETWLETIDLWRMAEAIERAELSSS